MQSISTANRRLLVTDQDADRLEQAGIIEFCESPHDGDVCFAYHIASGSDWNDVVARLGSQ